MTLLTYCVCMLLCVGDSESTAATVCVGCREEWVVDPGRSSRQSCSGSFTLIHSLRLLLGLCPSSGVVQVRLHSSTFCALRLGLRSSRQSRSGSFTLIHSLRLLLGLCPSSGVVQVRLHSSTFCALRLGLRSSRQSRSGSFTLIHSLRLLLGLCPSSGVVQVRLHSSTLCVFSLVFAHHLGSFRFVYTHPLSASSPWSLPIIWGRRYGIQYHSSTSSCPMRQRLSYIFYTSLSTWFSIFRSVSFLVMVHLIFFLARAFRPFFNMSIPLKPFLCDLLCHWCYIHWYPPHVCFRCYLSYVSTHPSQHPHLIHLQFLLFAIHCCPCLCAPYSNAGLTTVLYVFPLKS